jgi:hypothetical protein
VGWDAELEGVACLLQCGTVRVTSLDTATILDLAPSRKSFRVLYPALSSTCPTRGTGASEYTYFRITQLFPCARFPSRWNYPLKIAMAFAARHAPPHTPPSASTITSTSTQPLQIHADPAVPTSTTSTTSYSSIANTRRQISHPGTAPSLFDVVIELPKLSRPSYPAPLAPAAVTSPSPTSLFAKVTSDYRSPPPSSPAPVLPAAPGPGTCADWPSAWAPSPVAAGEKSRELAREWWGKSNNVGINLLHSTAGALPSRVPVLCEWNRSGLFWTLDDGGAAREGPRSKTPGDEESGLVMCVLHDDESCLVWDGQGHGFFHHYRPELLGAHRTYAPEALPDTFNRSGRLVPHIQYKLRPLGQHLKALASHARQLGVAEAGNRSGKAAAPLKGSKEVESRQYVEGVGDFILHRDTTIRVLFIDRTLLYIEPRPGTHAPLSVCRFLLPCGREYDAPLEALLRPTASSPTAHAALSPLALCAMEFRAWASLSPLEHDAIRQKERQRDAFVTAQCDRSRRLLLLQRAGQGKGWAPTSSSSSPKLDEEAEVRVRRVLEANKAVVGRLEQARVRTAEALLVTG